MTPTQHLTTTSSERKGHDRTRELSAEELHQAAGLGIRQFRRMEKQFADVI